MRTKDVDRIVCGIGLLALLLYACGCTAIQTSRRPCPNCGHIDGGALHKVTVINGFFWRCAVAEGTTNNVINSVNGGARTEAKLK